MKCFINPFELQYESIDIGVPATRNIYVLYKNTTILNVEIDERFNSIVIQVLEQIPGLEINQISDLIHMSYISLRDSDPGYGNDFNGILFENTKKIFVEDFINYLKIKNREKIIDKLNG